ncbi:MAG: efflux RND transporter permease subunit [Bacillota bacterium]
MDKLAKFVKNHSTLIIVFVGIITAVMGYYALQIEIEAGIKDMLPEDNKVVERYENIQDTFGGMAFAAIMLEDDEIIDSSSLEKVEEMTNELENVEGVNEVKSLTNIEKIEASGSGIEVKEFVKKLPENEKEAQKIKNDLLSYDQYLGKIVTKDFKSTVLLAEIEDEDKPEAVVNRIQKTVKDYEGPEKIHITGSPVMVADATDYMKSDLQKLLPFVIGAILIILYLSFRSIRGVLLPISTVLISVVWAVGLQSILGKSLSLVSTVLPVLLVSVGSAYAIHIVARYYEELKDGRDIEKAVKNTIKKVGIAVIMAGGTTMIGFASLFFSDLVIIQDFALGTAFGVGIALLTAILFIPAVLYKMKTPSHLKAAEKRSFSTNFFKGIYKIVRYRRKAIIILVIIIIALSSWVLPKLKPNTNYISYFKKDSPTRIATEKVDSTFGGSQPLNVVVHGNIKNPDLLKRMRDFQDDIKNVDAVNNPLSIVTLFRQENRALTEDTKENEVIPETENKIAQYLLLLEMSDKEMLENYITFDYETSMIQMTMETMSSTEQKEKVAEVRSLIDKHFGDEYKVELTGIPELGNEVTDLVVSGQIKSLISAIAFTFLVTSLLLRSIKRGFFCSLPIALTVLINFGIMGWLGISLDIATVMVASIAVGIGVDYSIHIFTRFLEEKEKKESEVKALKEAIFTVGRANLYNAIAVIAGFCIILLSSFPPLITFGALTAITMVISFVGALIILPSLIMSTIKIINGNLDEN